MQINSAVYFYDYHHIHTFGEGPNAFGSTRRQVFAAPAAEMIGVDTDVLWLVNQGITLGATVSFTHSEYTEDFDIVECHQPGVPGVAVQRRRLPR